jgi:tetratricopeptide (TPR) repeat protein
LSSAPDVIAAARNALSEGRPAQAEALLGRLRACPAPFRPERDFLRAEALRARGFFGKAEALYDALLRRPGLLEPELLAEAALGSASGHRSLGAVAKARARLSLAGREPSLKDRVELEALLIERAAGKYGPAIAGLRRLLARARRERDWPQASFLEWAIGGAERFRGRLAASRAAFRSSLAFASRAADPIGRGYALFGLGGVTRIMGRLAESARHYSAAERAFRRTDDVFAQAYASCGLANALRQLGRLPEAQKLYRRAHVLYSSLDDGPDLAYVDWGLGKISLARGELAAAQARLQRALRLFLKHDEQRGAVLSEVALAQTLHARGGTALAERLFARAQVRARRAGLHAHLEVFT